MRTQTYTSAYPVSSSTTSYNGAPHINTTTSTTRYTNQVGPSYQTTQVGGMPTYQSGTYQSGTSSYTTTGTSYPQGATTYPAQQSSSYQATTYPAQSGSYQATTYPTQSGSYQATTYPATSSSYQTGPVTYPAHNTSYTSTTHTSSSGQGYPAYTTTTGTPAYSTTGGVYTGTSPYPAPAYSSTTGYSTAAGTSIQYTSEASQKYTPPGCQPVNAFPHGISTIYSTGLVPAFMAPPDVKIPTGSFVNWGIASVPETTSMPHVIRQ